MTDMDIEPNQLTVEEEAAINSLRDRGFCVVIWTPEELGDADSGHLEDIVIERGNNFLELYKGEEKEDLTP